MRVLLASLFWFYFAAPAFAAVPVYTITDLGALPRPVRHQETVGVFAINDRGQIVGGSSMAWRWEKGMKTKLGTLAPETYEEEFGSRSVAYGINAQGQIVGASGSYTHVFMGFNYFARAVRFDAKALKTLADSNTRYEAYSINDRGQIVGQGAYRAFYFANNKLISMGTLSKAPQGNASEARCINNRGVVVGSTTVDTGKPDKTQYFLPTHAFLWRRSERRMHDLGTLPGYSASSAEHINMRGQIVGSCGQQQKDGQFIQRATLWENGKIRALSVLPGSVTSEAFGVNVSGQIVGYCSPRLEAHTISSSRAVLWDDKKVYDLNTCLAQPSGWVLQRARAINSTGWIVGDGTLGGEYHAFLLTPSKN